MKVSIEQMEAFVSSAEEGSFSAAARKLRKAQSAISIAVSNMEIDLGIELFDRSGKYPNLTLEGEAILRDVKNILLSISQMQSRADSFSEDVDASIRIAIDEIAPNDFIINLFERFYIKYPETNLEILYGALGDIKDMVQNGRADIGLLIPLSTPDKSIVSLKISEVTFNLIASSKHPLAKMDRVSANDLERYHQLCITSRGGEREPELAILTSKIWMIENTHTTIDLVKKGLGFAILPDYLTDEHIAKGELKEIKVRNSKPVYNAGIYIIHKPSVRFGKAGRWIIEEFSKINENQKQL